MIRGWLPLRSNTATGFTLEFENSDTANVPRLSIARRRWGCDGYAHDHAPRIARRGYKSCNHARVCLTSQHAEDFHQARQLAAGMAGAVSASARPADAGPDQIRVCLGP